jgi:transcriptional regulator with XRE-family HTH domain
MSWKKEEILELRNSLGLNRTDFAKMLGVDVRSVMRWEKGLCRPTGAPEAILSGVKEKIDKNPEALPAVRDFIAGAVSVGGLAYLIVKLLDLAGTEHEGGRGW